MFPWILIFILLVIIGALLGLGSYYYINHRKDVLDREDVIDYWYNQCEAYRIENETLKGKAQVKAYEALEQGFSEVTDAYETDMLQYTSTIDDLKEQIEQLIADKKRIVLALQGAKDELDDVRQTALSMQIDLTRKGEVIPRDVTDRTL